jgi:hypothetical protein
LAKGNNTGEDRNGRGKSDQRTNIYLWLSNESDGVEIGQGEKIRLGKAIRQGEQNMTGDKNQTDAGSQIGQETTGGAE